MNTISKDNVGSIAFLAASLALIIAALFSSADASAKTEQARSIQVEKIVVTASKLK